MSSPSATFDSSESSLAPNMSDIIVEFNRVSVGYGAGPSILSDVDLQLTKGSFTFLTGSSGAGKSTLLKLLYMGLRPSSGQVSIFGQNTSSLSPRHAQLMKRRIGIVSQDIALIEHLDVFQNAALPLRVTGGSRADYGEDAIELLRWVGLGDALGAFPATLSGGERQRVAIARAVIARPKFLIADEPTGNVDPVMGQKLLRLFMEMNRGGTTIIIATHDQGLLKGIRADTLHLQDGRVTKGLSS